MISLLNQLKQLPKSGQPHVLTIGNFDGVHLGHLAILQRVKQLSQAHTHPSVVLTFSNHPSEILRPSQVTPFLCHPNYRYRLLKEQGIDQIIVLPFTADIASLSAHAFLNQLHSCLNFSHLVLGHDATIGKGREGNRERVENLAQAMGFKVEYCPPVTVQNAAVSSSLIRHAVQAGKLEEATKLLGKPFSLTGIVVPGLGKGRKLGFPTINIDVAQLCLPPLGVYGVEFLAFGGRFRGIANLGVAPTVRAGGPPLLEVHLLDPCSFQAIGLVETVITSFVRPEKRFSSLEELKRQIAEDISVVRGRGSPVVWPTP